MPVFQFDPCILVCQCVSGTDSWQRVNTEIPVKSPRFALFDLAEGKSYSFRVRCCNSAGVGEPSDPTEATTVGDKLGQKTSIHARIITAAMLHSQEMTQNVKCCGPQISHLPQAKSSLPETQTRQSLCLGKRPARPKSWWVTTSRGVLWAATCGSHATTSL